MSGNKWRSWGHKIVNYYREITLKKSQDGGEREWENESNMRPALGYSNTYKYGR